MHKLTPIFAILLILSLLVGNVGTAKADSTVVVTPTNMGNWSFHQFVPTGSGEIMDGPDTPPLGFGSARLTSSPNGGMSLQSTDYSGMRLDALTRLEYSSYRATSDPNNNRTVTLQFEMDYDIDDPTKGVMGWLVFEPYWTGGSGTVMEDTWYTWNALTGKWYATDDIGTDLCTQSNPCTITELLSTYPDAGVRHNGVIRFAAGASWNLAFTGYADALTVGESGVNTTFDFETVVPNYPPTADAGGPYTGDEGSNVSIAGTASDLGGDPLTYGWTYTPGPSVDPGTTCTFGDAAALSTTFNCTDNGLFTLILAVNDGVNPATSDSTSAFLSNLAPVLNINLPVDGTSFPQGQQVDLSAQVEEPGDNDTLSCQVDWGDGTTTDGVLVGENCTANHTYIQPGDYTLTVTVTDDDGGSNSDTTGITVVNVSPTVDITIPVDSASFSTGTSVNLSADVFDPSGDDLLACTVDWGDGETSDGLITDGVCSASHVYAQPAEYLITVTVTDEDGGTTTDTVSINVTNLAPIVEAGGPYTGGEGSTTNLSGFATDSEGDSLTYAWTYTPTAAVDAGTTCTFADPTAAATGLSCTDNGSFTLSLTVDDGINPPVIDTASLTVNNLTPVVTIDEPADGSTYLFGEAVTLNATFTDPGGNDGHTCQVNWSDGAVTNGLISANACIASHTYTIQGEVTLTVTVSDDDGGNGSASVNLTISAEPQPKAGPLYLPLMNKNWNASH